MIMNNSSQRLASVILVIYCSAQYVLCNYDSVQSTDIQSTNNNSRDSTFIHFPSVKDIVDRLHQLDSDIGKLMFNSTSMYSPRSDHLNYIETSKPAEKFTEVLADLDSLQDEVNVIVKNVTRTRQYNILVRLRPLNTLLYRIRHNLHLMRNSLVALNTVTSLEKIANTVMDSTLNVFLKPEGQPNDEPGEESLDDGSSGSQGDPMRPDPSEEAAIAEAEAAANAQDFQDNFGTAQPNRVGTNDYYGQQQPSSSVNQQISSAAIATTASTTTTTTTTTTQAPLIPTNQQANVGDQPARKPEPQVRPVRTRIQATSTTKPVSSSTTTPTPIESPSSQKPTSNAINQRPIESTNTNRNPTIQRVPQANVTRPNSPSNRVRINGARPNLELATE